MASKACPPLGTGSVDMNALHEAAMKGNDLARALEKATTRPEPSKPEATAAPKRARAASDAETSTRDSKSSGNKADA